MPTPNLLAAVLGAAALLPATALFSDGPQSVITGQASYRERIALPPGALFEATLEDVSRPGAKAEILGTVRIENATAVPIRFEIPYDRASVDERHSYAVRARIFRGDRLLFTTDTVHPVLTRGAGTTVDLLLVRSRARIPPETPPARLDGTHWTLVELDGKPLPAGLPDEAYLELEAEPRRLSGSGGCNRISGEYERDGDRLAFKALALTGRACLQGMDAEVAFRAALGRVRAFRLAGARLELADETGRIVAAFSARVAPATASTDR